MEIKVCQSFSTKYYGFSFNLIFSVLLENWGNHQLSTCPRIFGLQVTELGFKLRFNQKKNLRAPHWPLLPCKFLLLSIWTSLLWAYFNNLLANWNKRDSRGNWQWPERGGCFRRMSNSNVAYMSQKSYGRFCNCRIIFVTWGHKINSFNISFWSEGLWLFFYSGQPQISLK